MLLQGKKILLGISGSIAAYKTPELVRQLIKKGAEVKVILTDGGAQFVTPLALSTVAKQEVFLGLANDNQQWHNHVALGLWADIFIIAPASANTIAKMAQGICDNMLLATYLSSKCTVMFAPAMDLDMWAHPATQRNIQTLLQDGLRMIPPENGELASGLVGTGRMAAPENIVSILEHYCYHHMANNNRPKALVSAGPTYEAIDPVRFIGNHSTGKMGIALAEALADAGYNVSLVLGPTTWTTKHPGVNTIPVTDAASMYDACMNLFPNTEIAIMAAAVADFRPENKASQKIKKGEDDTLTLKLTKTNDILASLGKIKTNTQKLVGFALETNNEIAHAQAKLVRKNADYIVLNSLNEAGAGFGGDTNKVYILERDKESIKELPLQSKQDTAKAIVSYILK